MDSSWTEVDGLRVHARASRWPVDDDAPTAVLVHGFVVSSIYMVPTALRLRPRWRVLAPDLPGFGASDHPSHPYSVPELADALAGFLRARRLSGATLLGNSLGCQVVVDLAVRYPELAGALVLVGPTVDPAARTIAQQAGRILLDAPRERPSLVALHARDWLRAGPREIISTLRIAVADRIEEKLPRVAAPTLVVVGSRDPLVPPAWAERATALLPRGRLVVVAGGPHALNYSRPDAVARAMKSLPSAPGLSAGLSSPPGRG